MDNSKKFPIEYTITSDSPTFTVNPESGVIKPSSSGEAAIRWSPPMDGSITGASKLCCVHVRCAVPLQSHAPPLKPSDPHPDPQTPYSLALTWTLNPGP